MSNLYQQINMLSADIIDACHNDAYENASNLLTERLALLKKLSQKITSFDEGTPEKQTYYDFLQSLKSTDESQMASLHIARDKSLFEHSQQQKIKKAINIYKTLSD